MLECNTDLKAQAFVTTGSSLICPIALVFALFNSKKTPFSYDMRYNRLHGGMRKLDAIKETEKSYMAILNTPNGTSTAVRMSRITT